MIAALLLAVFLAFSAYAGDDKPTQAQATSSSVVNAAPVLTSTTSDPVKQSVTEVFPHQAPAVFAPSADSTSSCRNAISAGGSFLTGGAGVGFSRRDSECEKRAAAEAFLKIGDQEDAFFLLCELKVARHLESCKRNWPPESVRRKK